MRRLTPGCGTRQVSLAVLCGAAARGQYRALQKQLPCLPRKAARLGNRCCRCRLDGVLGTLERNPELGITFLMSSRTKCRVSRTNVLWERTAGDFTPHYPKTLLLSGDRLVGGEDAR